MDQLDMLTEEPAAETAEVVQLPPQAIDAKTFEAMYDKMLADGIVQRPSVLAVLRAKRYRLEVNQWVHLVQNQHEQSLMEDVRDAVVNHLRRATLNPTLQLVVQVDETMQPQAEERLFTSEEKLRMLEGKNPHLRAFLERFTAVID